MYIFEGAGPPAFLETHCSVTSDLLKNIKSSQHLLSANDMLDTILRALPVLTL